MTRSAVAAVLLCCATVPAWADGIHLNGVSPRSIGRGGTNLGFADNGAILFDNPAAAINISSEGLFEIGGGVLITDMRYSDPDNASAHDVNAVPIPQFAIIRRAEFDENLAYGLGVFTPAGFSQTFQLEGQFPYGGERTYKSWGSLTKIVPSLAYRVTDQLSIGGTLGVGFSHAELEGPYTLQNAGMLTGMPTVIDLQATGVTPIFSAGLQYLLTEATTLGLAYQSESRFQLEGNTRATLPVIGPYGFDADVNMTWPRTLGLGVRHQLDPARVVAMDVIWFNWSSAFDDFGITLTDEAHPAATAIHEQFPLRWRDTVSFRFGYEELITANQTIRAGYVYHRNPIPSETLTPYTPAILEHCFSVGYGLRWGLWDLDAAYMFTFSPRIAVGDSDFLGGDFDNSSYKAYTHFIGVNAIRRF